MTPCAPFLIITIFSLNFERPMFQSLETTEPSEVTVTTYDTNAMFRVKFVLVIFPAGGSFLRIYSFVFLYFILHLVSVRVELNSIRVKLKRRRLGVFVCLFYIRISIIEPVRLIIIAK